MRTTLRSLRRGLAIVAGGSRLATARDVYLDLDSGRVLGFPAVLDEGSQERYVPQAAVSHACASSLEVPSELYLLNEATFYRANVTSAVRLVGTQTTDGHVVSDVVFDLEAGLVTALELDGETEIAPNLVLLGDRT